MFEVFDLSKQYNDLEPFISISQYGKFNFNKEATDFLISKEVTKKFVRNISTPITL